MPGNPVPVFAAAVLLSRVKAGSMAATVCRSCESGHHADILIETTSGSKRDT